MKDYADKEWIKQVPCNPMEDKLGAAVAYLLERGIYRGRARCNHQYTNSEGRTIRASLSTYTSNGRGMP